MFRSEEWFIRLCTNYLLDSDCSTKYDMKNSDWKFFLKMANHHGIGPLLYYNLGRSEKSIPSEVMESLKEQYYLNLIRNDFLYSELSHILVALREANIDTIITKGAAIAETIYLNRGLRPFSDIDILIKKESLERAGKVLNGLGYTLDRYATPPVFSEKFDYHHRYVKGAVIVEFHWDFGLHAGIYKFMKLNNIEIWRNSIKSQLSGIDIRIPSDEDLIILSCIHCAKHKYSRLIWLYDIQQIVEHHWIDWGHIIMKANSCHAARSVFYALSLTKELLGLVMPEHMLDEIRPPAYEIRLFKFLMSLESLGFLNIVKDMILRLLLIDRHIDRLKFFVTYPGDAIAYLLLGNKRKTLKRMKEGKSVL